MLVFTHGNTRRIDKSNPCTFSHQSQFKEEQNWNRHSWHTFHKAGIRKQVGELFFKFSTDVEEIEMFEIAKYYNANQKTFMGLSGLGDIIVTCTSRHSRNRYVGEKLGKGEKIEDIIKNMLEIKDIWDFTVG